MGLLYCAPGGALGWRLLGKSWAACSGSACLLGEYRVSLASRGQWT
jgi:hypothetical protein